MLLDLSRVYQRRVQVYGDSNAGEIDKANSNLMEARQLDPTLPAIASEDPFPKEILGNDRLRTLPAAPAPSCWRWPRATCRPSACAASSRQMLVGDVPSAVALVYPLLVALLLLGFGFLGKSLEAAKVCNRCGRPVSKRGDPDVSPGSPMCTQCVNVFARKNVVAPSVKVRKQLEVARYESQMERASTVLGVLWSGMGHVFSGAPVRGRRLRLLLRARHHRGGAPRGRGAASLRGRAHGGAAGAPGAALPHRLPALAAALAPEAELTMALKGTLKDFGIADILQLIGQQQKTGVLVLTQRRTPSPSPSRTATSSAPRPPAATART